jgi:hypothetical protein
MATQEDRIAALEQKVADIELERLYERKKATESTSAEQAYDIKQVNHRLTMLLGIASGQEHDIRAVKEDMNLRFDAVDRQIAELKQSTEAKFEQVLQQLTAIAAKLKE